MNNKKSEHQKILEKKILDEKVFELQYDIEIDHEEDLFDQQKIKKSKSNFRS